MERTTACCCRGSRGCECMEIDVWRGGGAVDGGPPAAAAAAAAVVVVVIAVSVSLSCVRRWLGWGMYD